MLPACRCAPARLAKRGTVHPRVPTAPPLLARLLQVHPVDERGPQVAGRHGRRSVRHPPHPPLPGREPGAVLRGGCGGPRPRAACATAVRSSPPWPAPRPRCPRLQIQFGAFRYFALSTGGVKQPKVVLFTFRGPKAPLKAKAAAGNLVRAQTTRQRQPNPACSCRVDVPPCPARCLDAVASRIHPAPIAVPAHASPALAAGRTLRQGPGRRVHGDGLLEPGGRRRGGRHGAHRL